MTVQMRFSGYRCELGLSSSNGWSLEIFQLGFYSKKWSLGLLGSSIQHLCPPKIYVFFLNRTAPFFHKFGEFDDYHS